MSQKIDEQTTISTTNTSRLDNAKNNAAFFQSVTDFFIYMSSSSTEKDKDAETLKKNDREGPSDACSPWGAAAP